MNDFPQQAATGDPWDGSTLAGWPQHAFNGDAITEVAGVDAPSGCPTDIALAVRIDGTRKIGGWGSRSEVIRGLPVGTGDRTRLTWHHFYPDDFPVPSSGGVILTDFHSRNLTVDVGGGVNITIRQFAGEMIVDIMGGRMEGPVPKGTPYTKFAKALGYTATAGWSLPGPSTDPAAGLYAVERRDIISLGPVEQNVWYEWLLDVTWSSEADGHVTIWRDGTQVVDVPGPTLFSTAGVVRGIAHHAGMYVPSDPHAVGSAWLAGMHELSLGNPT